MASESVLVDIGRFVHRISLEEMKRVLKFRGRNYNKFNTLIRESEEKQQQNHRKRIFTGR